MQTRSRIALSVVVFVLAASAAVAKDFPKFQRIEIDPHAGEVVYAVTHADVNGDEKQDIVAVTEDAVYWYENPTWKKHTIIKDQTVKDNVCIAAHDIDADGKIDFALGAGWLNGRNQGTIQWLSRKESLDEPWDVHFIGEIPWTHRMRWGDVLMKGRPQLVVSPLNKTVGDGVKLTAFEMPSPSNAKKERWPATVIDESLNRVHNHWIVGEAPRAPIFLFTASEEGIYAIFKNPRKNDEFIKGKISDGASGEKPTERGAGEIKVDKDRKLLATIEPMHGNMAAVYLKQPKQDGQPASWKRHVLDDTLGRGHAVWLADFDDDGNDEIVIGHSDPGTGEIKGPGVFVYQADDDTGEKWTKHVIDNGGVATEDAFASDLTGDGKQDIVAGGRNTHNVVLYVNQGS
jgi:hypothetical protein